MTRNFRHRHDRTRFVDREPLDSDSGVNDQHKINSAGLRPGGSL
jgi:hypothetical protein